MAENIDTQLSATEAELYDRQIRLWGIESQEKLRAANVLIINIRGLGSEITKNILLCGINCLTILDDGVVTEEVLSKNFLLSRDSIGKKIAEAVLPKAQALNPLVKIVSDTDTPSEKDSKFFEQFTIIIATDTKTDLLLKIDKYCHKSQVKLIAGDVFGTFGCSVADFLKHEYYEDRINLLGKKRKLDSEDKETVKVQGVIEYPELNKVLILPNSKQSIEGIKKINKKNEYFFLMLVLLEFRNQKGRNPQIAQRVEDITTLKTIKKSVSELYNVGYNIFDDTVFDLIFGEVPPVCAILGGVIAQEVIKAVSHKEITVNNLFLFDPIRYNGREERIGA